MKIRWLAHAAFLIEGDGLRIITDPFDPSGDMNLPPIEEAADIVIRSSDDDRAHAHVDTIPDGYELVTATDILETGATARGIDIRAVWAQESHIHKDVVRDNAMYRFSLEGIELAHMGDVGNPLTPSQLDALAGVDVLFALVGGPPTIELDDLAQVIETVAPKIVIPMHYRIPGPQFFMLPVTEFTGRYPDAMVEWAQRSEIEITQETLPTTTRIVVLEPTLTNPAT